MTEIFGFLAEIGRGTGFQPVLAAWCEKRLD